MSSPRRTRRSTLHACLRRGLANTAIDGIVNDPQAVLEDVLRFASSDMLCYRAGSPERLVNRQTELWDPVIDWAASHLGARFVLAEGVMHVEQPREALGAFSVHLGAFTDPFAIASLHTITTLTGSAILALAVAKGEVSGADAWRLAHVDEDWTIEHWGEDAEAAARRAMREREMIAAVKMLEAVTGGWRSTHVHGPFFLAGCRRPIFLGRN